MNDETDVQLLRAYAEHRSEPAFAELVRRHVDFVYSAALRMVCDAHLAQDVTQAVFVALAKNAGQLTRHPVLSGWLHRTAQNIAAQTVRTNARRRVREQEAVAMNALLAAEPNADWQQIAPQLDAALGELPEADRDALLLRYFERKSAREMAQVLGVSDEAAQKRVTRAVERLRELFTKRGVTVGASGLVVVLTANAMEAAPVGLAVTISSAVTLAGTTLTSTVVATKALAMTTLQKTLIATTIVAVAGLGIYQVHQNSNLRSQLHARPQQTGPAGQSQTLTPERDPEAAKALAALREENERLQKDRAELPRLRGEVARLRRDIKDLAKSADANDPFVKKALKWKANEARLRQLFEERPEQRVPQMQLLSNESWLDLAREEDLESEGGIRTAFSEVRRYAENQFVNSLSDALKKFTEAHDQKIPDALSQLKPYFDPPVTDALLEQYKLLHTGKLSEVPRGEWVITEKSLVDEEYDTRWGIGAGGFGPLPPSQKTMTTMLDQLAPAIKAFTEASNGKPPTELEQLKPYLQNPALKEVAERLDRMGGYLPR